MYRRIESESSLRLGTVLVILTVLASAMAVLFILHTGTDDSSADVMDSGQCGDNVNYVYSSDGTLKISGTGGMYDYSKANAPWSEYSSDITKIAIDNNITSLGEWAFRDCTNLKELSIPITLNSVRSNEHPAFAGCTNIERIDLTYGTNGYGCWYAAYPVDGCWYQNTPWYQSRDSLKELNLADNVKGIGSDTFRELNITSLVLPDSLTIVGDHCFFNCTKLTELTYPVSLRPFCNEKYPSFRGCVAIEKVTLTRGNGVPFDYGGNYSYGDRYSHLAPWNMNPDVKKTIVISNDISKLGIFSFYDCNIKELSIPISIDYDNNVCGFDRVFEGIKNSLEKVTITKGSDGASCNNGANISAPWNIVKSVNSIVVEEGITRIGTYTFNHCNVDNLVLPNSLASFGDGYVFADCNIRNMTIPITLNAVWYDSNYTAAFNCHLSYVSGFEKITFTPGDTGIGFDYSAYLGDNCWYNRLPWYHCRSTLKEIVFEDGIKSIGSDAFRGLKITSVVIPDSVQSLGNHAFFHCYKLTDITIPITLDSVGSTQYPVFDQCNAITTVRLTAGDTGIGCDYTADHLPVWCNLSDKIGTITLDKGIKSVGSHTFDGFTFTDFDGSILEPTAENLGGHTFNRDDGNMHITDRIPSSPVPYFYFHSVVEPVSARDRF